jgi:hypothetical protein
MQVYSLSQKKVIDVPDNQASSTPQTQPASDPNNPKYITGHSPAEHQAALQAARQANNKDAIKAIQDDYKTEVDYQKENAKNDPANVELKGAAANDVNLWKNAFAAAQSAQGKYKSSYSGLLDNIIGKGKIATNRPEAKDIVAYKQDIADIRTAIRQYISGAAIPKSEAGEFTKLIPDFNDSDSEVQQKLKGIQEMALRKIENTIQTAGYNVSGEEYLGKKAQDTVDHQGARVDPATGLTREQQIKYGKEAASNIIPDVKQMGGNLAQAAPVIGKILMDNLASFGKVGGQEGHTFMPNQQGADLVTGAMGGIANSNYNTLLNPDKSYSRQHPVETLLNVLPFLGMLKGASALSKGTEAASAVGDVADVTAQTAPKAAEVAAVTPKTGVVAKGKSLLDDVLKGGGSKDYVKTTATKDLPTRNAVLRKYGAFNGVLPQKMIANTQAAMEKVGNALKDAYTNSKEIFTGDEIKNTFKQLIDQGYDEKAVKAVERYFKNAGDFKIGVADHEIPLVKIWDKAKHLRDHPPKFLEDAESTKNLAEDAARLIRDKLAEKGGTSMLNHEYHTLADYMKNGLPKNTNGIGGKIVSGAGRTAIGYASYDILKRILGSK